MTALTCAVTKKQFVSFSWLRGNRLVRNRSQRIPYGET